MPYYNRDPKRDHNFDNHPCKVVSIIIDPQGSQYPTVRYFVFGTSICSTVFWGEVYAYKEYDANERSEQLTGASGEVDAETILGTT